MTAVNLFTTFYREQNTHRYNELVYCLERNLRAGFNHIFILCDDQETSHEVAYEAMKLAELIHGEDSGFHQKITVDFLDNQRVTFNHIFAEMRKSKYQGCINIMANTDIFFPDLEVFNLFYDCQQQPEKQVLALSRWDWNGDENVTHFNRADSQDTWVFFGGANIVTGLEFGFGVAGNDNRLAHEIVQAGYNITNPSKTIRTYHVHNTNVRNYVKDGVVVERVPPPYHLVTPQ